MNLEIFRSLYIREIHDKEQKTTRQNGVSWTRRSAGQCCWFEFSSQRQFTLYLSLVFFFFFFNFSPSSPWRVTAGLFNDLIWLHLDLFPFHNSPHIAHKKNFVCQLQERGRLWHELPKSLLGQLTWIVSLTSSFCLPRISGIKIAMFYNNYYFCYCPHLYSVL